MRIRHITYIPIAAFILLAPVGAEASWLPGWGSFDGTPGLDPYWCHGTGNELHVGDFNGDGKSDLMCHTTTTGRRRVDLGDADVRGFWGSDWDSNTDGGAVNDWCSAAGEEIFVGDFNGDG
ncbi:MAG: hypothetical protein KC431_27435, partial [Myxococcales bacterium]|nr:hypothetical protein [Myxococcales bacterium]